MKADEILHQFAAKTLEEPLHNVSIQHRERIFKATSGRLTVTENGLLRLEIFFAGEVPFQSLGLQPGMVIPNSDYATVTANTQTDFALTADRLFPEHTGWSMPGFGRIVFFPDKVLLISSTLPNKKAGLEGIVASFSEDVFNADYLVEDNCPMFGSIVHRTWLTLEFDHVRLGLRKDHGELIWLKLWSKTEGDPGLERLSKGFLWALSFVLGRRLHWQAFSSSIDNEERVILRRQIKATKKHFPPLPDWPTQQLMKKRSELLQQATLYFQDPTNEPVLTALQVCWDATENIFVTHGLLLCAALEGLAGYLVHESPRSDVLSAEKEAFAKLKGRAVHVLTSDEFLSKNVLLKRITARVSSSDYSSADKIRKAGELLGVNIANREIAAWKNRRHVAAHGDFEFDFGDQKKVQSACNETATVANILNKFVLGLIGYKGPFRDYGAPGYPMGNFPN